jgi:predicted dehydrogenase
MTPIVKLGVVGGRRGAAFDKSLEYLREQVELTAICDLSESVLATWASRRPGIRAFTSYERFLDESGCTAVFLATPYPLHEPQAIQALRSGKHVISEVIAATSLDQCWELVETVEQTGLTYMMAENYCYMRPNMFVLNMLERGVFGEISYAEGGYIHDTRDLMFDEQGNLAWRGQGRRDWNGNTYPTHSLGPVARWLKVNRPGGDRLVDTATFVTGCRSAAGYARERFGADHPAAQPGYWVQADSATTLIHTANGVLIVLRRDSASPRPHNMVHYQLQGSKASYLSARHEDEDPLIWIDGRSPGKSPSYLARWESLWTYKDEYEHPCWKDWGEQAAALGHGGGDFFVLRDFVQAIQTGTPPPIDVYDAVTWSSIMPLSLVSVAGRNCVVDIPDFTRRKRR